MKKKYIRIFSIIAGIVFLLFLVVNFGINLWLKYNLDNYIKNNSNYIVTYKTLDVDLGSGNIRSTGITINSKNPQNQDIIGFQGTVDTLSVSRLGIYDAVFNNTINTSNLVLNRPNINIILPKKNTDKKAKKQNDLVLENIKITNGNIQIFKATKQKMLSVKDFNLVVENLEMTKESASDQLPFTFDQYQINGKDFYFRTDNIYAFTAKYITTKEGQISVKSLAVIPLLSYKNFLKFYPKKRNLFDFKSSEMEFKDIKLKDNKITLSKVRFENPALKMFTTNVKPAEKEKSFAYDVSLEDVIFNNSKIEILQPNGSTLFSAGNLNMSLNQFVMNEETAKGNLPFQYNNFKIAGESINYVSNTENVKVARLSVSPKLVDLKSISLKPIVSNSDKTLMDLTVQNINVKINELAFLDNKLKLNIDNVLIDGLNGKIVGTENPKKRKPAFEGIAFPLLIKNVSLKNSNLEYETGKKPLAFKDLNANIQNIELNDKTMKEALPFKIGFYSLSTRNFYYKTEYYNLSSSLLKVNKNSIHVSNFLMKPTVSRAQFIRMIPTEKDLYDLKIPQIRIDGNWDLFSNSKYFHASNIVLEKMQADICRSKIPKDDLSKKPMYSKLLRSIKIPFFVDYLAVNNSLLIYEEDTKKSDGPGKLMFTDFNLNLKNLNSGKMAGKPTKIPIEIRCLLMGNSSMKVNWNIDTASQSDAFTIAGTVSNIPASSINAFTEPYLKVRATGFISSLNFDFKGNLEGLDGTFKMKHEKLKVQILKEDGQKNTILTGIANLFVKTDSGKFPDSVPVKDVERDPTKSFFNLLWKGLEQGLKRTLIGIGVPETEATIKVTVSTTKDVVKTVKSNVKEVKKDIKGNVEVVKGNLDDAKTEVKKKGLLKKIFKKKNPSRD